MGRVDRYRSRALFGATVPVQEDGQEGQYSRSVGDPGVFRGPGRCSSRRRGRKGRYISCIAGDFRGALDGRAGRAGPGADGRECHGFGRSTGEQKE
jgi:hypothetical protein